MYYPSLKPIKTTCTAVKSFPGIDNRPGAAECTAEDTVGIDPTAVPYLKSVKTPNVLKTLDGGRVFYLGENYFRDGTKLYRGDTDTGVTLEGEVYSALKMGESAVFFPQKVYSVPGDHGSLTNTCSYDDARFTLCRKDGTDFPAPTVSATQPQNQSDGSLWIDTSGDTPVLKRCTMGVYYSVDSTYIHIQRGGIGVGFKKGDGVSIDGSVISGEYIIEYAENDRIVVAGIITEPVTGTVTVTRDVPDINFAAVSGNRVFAGASDGSAIYVSALGRYDGFNIFEGLSSDSYAADTPDGAPFTAVCAYMGEVYFFKENLIYVLRGTKPSNYQLSVIEGKGVKSGCHRSLVNYGGTLYYYGTDGFYGFDGTYPEKVLQQLVTPLSEVVSAVVGDTLYFSHTGGFSGVGLKTGRLFGISKKQYTDLLSVSDKLYYCDGEYYGDFTGAPGEFSVTFNEMGLTDDRKKSLSRINLSMYLGIDSNMTVYIGYDGEEPTAVFGEDSTCGKISEIPLLLRPHRTVKLKISGRGDWTLYSLNIYRKETNPCRM